MVNMLLPSCRFPPSFQRLEEDGAELLLGTYLTSKQDGRKDIKQCRQKVLVVVRILQFC